MTERRERTKLTILKKTLQKNTYNYIKYCCKVILDIFSIHFSSNHLYLYKFSNLNKYWTLTRNETIGKKSFRKYWKLSEISKKIPTLNIRFFSKKLNKKLLSPKSKYFILEFLYVINLKKKYFEKFELLYFFSYSCQIWSLICFKFYL